MKNRIGKSNRRAEILPTAYQHVMQKQAAKSVPKRENKFHLGNDPVHTIVWPAAFEFCKLCNVLIRQINLSLAQPHTPAYI